MIPPTPTLSVGVGRIFEFVCLSVCLSVCPQHNSKTNNPEVFKLGIGNDLGISCKWYGFEIPKGTWFWVERSKVNVRVRANSNTACVRTLWVPSSSVQVDTGVSNAGERWLSIWSSQRTAILCLSVDESEWERAGGRQTTTAFDTPSSMHSECCSTPLIAMYS